jgi:hypothetical protein
VQLELLQAVARTKTAGAGAPAPMDSVAIGSLLIPTQTLGAPVVRSLRKDTNRRPTKTAT